MQEQKGEPMTREEALTEIKERVCVTECVNSSYVDCVDIEALRMAIKALEEPHWIPCNEKLPKEEDFYLVTLYHEGVDRYYCSSALFLFKSCNYPGMRNFWVPHDDEYDMAVVAWRPLPEPWKGEG